MKTVVVAQSKGGVGKSTLVYLLSMALDNAQIPVAVLDHDPQGSAKVWLSEHLSTLPNIELLEDAAATPKRAAAVRLIDTERFSNYDDRLPDLPLADLYLIPATPALEDIRISGKTIALFRKHRPNANLRLVWNKIREGQDDSDPQQLREYAAQMGIAALKNHIHESKPYRDAQYPAPRGGWRRVTQSKFHRELRDVATEVLSSLIA